MFHPLVDINYEGYTLVVPSVSVGNIGQLCADLLISSLGCVKAGFLWHKAILPVVGLNPYTTTSKSLALGAEVYFSDEHKVAVLQLRSSLSKTYGGEFLQELCQWIKGNNITQTIVITGSSNEERIDQQIMSEPFRYLACNQSREKFDADFRELGWIQLEQRFRFPAMSRAESCDESSSALGKHVIPGGGFAKRFYSVCCENDVPCLVLIKFCSEGDNIPDALLVATKLNTWRNMVKEDEHGRSRWIFPPSWRLLFGNPPPKQLY